MAQMKYFYELTISSSPHAHSPITTRTIMRDVLIALVPALVGAVYFFGFRALTVTAVSVAACVFFEWLYCKLMKKPCKTYDLSACVTGVLLAFVCPVTIPYWTIILGDAFAILLVKMLFGGLGKNIVNPALAGRAFMFSWPVLMSNWVKVGFENAAGLISSADAVTAAVEITPVCEEVMKLLPLLFYYLILEPDPGELPGAAIAIAVGFATFENVCYLAENGAADYDDLCDVAANYDFDYDFLAEVPYGEVNRLEGYLFPDTYEFYVDDDAETVLNKFLRNFQRKMTDDLYAFSTSSCA